VLTLYQICIEVGVSTPTIGQKKKKKSNIQLGFDGLPLVLGLPVGTKKMTETGSLFQSAQIEEQERVRRLCYITLLIHFSTFFYINPTSLHGSEYQRSKSSKISPKHTCSVIFFFNLFVFATN
jgi:hypothetical protein